MKRYKDIVGDGGSNIVEQVTEQSNRVKSRLATVKHVITVMSGKGGVGKSAVTVNLAAALALEDFSVGILDADINGPSIAKMSGVRGHNLERHQTGVMPAESDLKIKIMSIDLFLPDDDAPVIWDAPTQKDAYTWRGMMEIAALRELLADTEWGSLDYLLIDLPPGTDKLPNMNDLLLQLSGTIIVTIPSGVSQFVVGKSIYMAKEVLKTPVIGVVENMSEYICSHCGNTENLFPAGHVEEFCHHHQVPYLGKIPFDPRIAVAADKGSLFIKQFADLPAGRAIHEIASKVNQFCGGKE